jgi:hypothetical protein
VRVVAQAKPAAYHEDDVLWHNIVVLIVYR